MGGHGHRNMFYATGLPGWVRFGYSPGWGGLPPAWQYLRNTGQMGAVRRTFPSQGVYRGTDRYPFLGMSEIDELDVLTAQKDALERSLEALTRRIVALESAEAGSEKKDARFG